MTNTPFFQSSRSIPNSSFHLVQTTFGNKSLPLACCSCQKGFAIQLFPRELPSLGSKVLKEKTCSLPPVWVGSWATPVGKQAGLSFEMKFWMNLPFWQPWCFEVSRTLPDFCIPLCFFLYPPTAVLCYFFKWFLQSSAPEAQPAPGLDIPQGISHKQAEQEGCCGLSVPLGCRCALFD